MTIREASTYAVKQLNKLYTDDEQISVAHWLLEWVTGMSAAEVTAHSATQLTNTQQELLKIALHEHVVEHKPLQYIFGTVPFLSLTLTVRPPVLIPRPETEYWCSYLIEKLQQLPNQQLTILDMCTGSGCIALALAKALPDAKVYAVDKLDKACELAKENAQKNGLSINVVQSDLFLQLPNDLRFDLIVSNPPYIDTQEWETLPESVKQWEDPSALLAHEHGLALLKQIINQAPAWLTKNPLMYRLPRLVVEIGYNQGKLVRDIFSRAGFTAIEVHKDLYGQDRFVTAEFHANT